MSNIDLMHEQYRTNKRISRGYKVSGAVRQNLLKAECPPAPVNAVFLSTFEKAMETTPQEVMYWGAWRGLACCTLLG
jgi:hypothetical protein